MVCREELWNDRKRRHNDQDNVKRRYNDDNDSEGNIDYAVYHDNELDDHDNEDDHDNDSQNYHNNNQKSCV